MADEVIVPEVAVETAETPVTETAVARDESGKFVSHQARKADLHSRLMAEGEAEDEVGYNLDEWEDDARGELIEEAALVAALGHVVHHPVHHAPVHH